MPYEKVSWEGRPIIGFLMLHDCRPNESRTVRAKDLTFELGQGDHLDNLRRERLSPQEEVPEGPRGHTIPIHPEALSQNGLTLILSFI